MLVQDLYWLVWIFTHVVGHWHSFCDGGGCCQEAVCNVVMRYGLYFLAKTNVHFGSFRNICVALNPEPRRPAAGVGVCSVTRKQQPSWDGPASRLPFVSFKCLLLQVPFLVAPTTRQLQMPLTYILFSIKIQRNSRLGKLSASIWGKSNSGHIQIWNCHF